MSTSRDVLAGLLELAPRLERLWAADLRRHGLTTPRLRVLSILHADGPLTSARLAQRLGVTPRAVTALVDGLETRRLVHRRPHPTDRRAALVELTAGGRRIVARLDGEAGELADELLAGTSHRQLTAGLAVIRRVDRELEARRL